MNASQKAERIDLYRRMRAANPQCHWAHDERGHWFRTPETLAQLRALVEAAEGKTSAPSRRTEKTERLGSAPTAKKATPQMTSEIQAYIDRVVTAYDRKHGTQSAAGGPSNRSGRGAELDIRMGLAHEHQGVRREGAVLVLGSSPPRQFPLSRRAVIAGLGD